MLKDETAHHNFLFTLKGSREMYKISTILLLNWGEKVLHDDLKRELKKERKTKRLEFLVKARHDKKKMLRFEEIAL